MTEEKIRKEAQKLGWTMWRDGGIVAFRNDDFYIDNFGRFEIPEFYILTPDQMLKIIKILENGK